MPPLPAHSEFGAEVNLDRVPAEGQKRDRLFCRSTDYTDLRR